jgi:predicted alpha/beta hydrolase family esterase
MAIVVGHSLGGSFMLKFLVEEEPRNRIAGIFLIAAPYWVARAGVTRDTSALP